MIEEVIPVALEAKEAKSLFAKIRGLIGIKPQALLIRTRFGIHTFGVRVPIDVIVLDEQNNVVKIKENLKPNRIFLYHPKHERVLELPQESAKKWRISIGTKVALTLQTI